MNGHCFEIVKDGPEAYLRVSDVLLVLSAEYSPKDRDQFAEFLRGILVERDSPSGKLN